MSAASRESLAEWVRARIQEARSSAPHLVVDGGRALQVWGTIGSVGYLTITGEAILDRDVGLEPGSFTTTTGTAAFRTVLFFASRRIPDLLRWLPSRSASDLTCSACQGSGSIPCGDRRPTCSACQGYGWLAPDADVP